MIKFDTTISEAKQISRIVGRAMVTAKRLKLEYTAIDCDMDITACHLNGNPLDLDKLEAFPDLDFGHDVFGIRRHIDRETGKLTNCFMPRCSKPESEPLPDHPAAEMRRARQTHARAVAEHYRDNE